MILKLSRILIILVILLTSKLSLASADGSETNKDKILVAVFRNAQPATFIDDENKPAGIFPETLSYILKEADYDFEFVLFSTFQEAYSAAVSGKVDIMPTLLKTDEREKVLDFNSQSFFISWSQVFISNSSRVESVFELRDKRIGVMKGGQNGKNFDDMMKSFEIPYEKVVLDTFDEITAEILSGNVDAGIFFSTFFNTELKIKPTNIIFSPSNSYFGVPKKTNQDLIELIDNALIKAKADDDSFYYKIMRKYRFVYQEDRVPGWIIILSISLTVLLIISAVFVMLNRHIIRRVSSNLIIEKQRAEKSNQLKTNFLLKVSHELRTPLNGIMGMLELLHYTDMKEDQQQYLKLAKQSSDNLYIIIQKLLDLNESSRAEMTTEIEEINIKSMLAGILGPIQKSAAAKGLKFKVEYPSNAVKWSTDKNCLRQMLIHLMLNAIDYSSSGTITVKVEAGEKLEIRVIDEGIGMNSHELDDIFIPFHQLEDPFTREHGGLGIGLTIVKQICEKIDAEIKVNSQPGKGSEFIITIVNQIK